MSLRTPHHTEVILSGLNRMICDGVPVAARIFLFSCASDASRCTAAKRAGGRRLVLLQED